RTARKSRVRSSIRKSPCKRRSTRRLKPGSSINIIPCDRQPEGRRCRLTQCSRFPWDPDSLICAWMLVPQEGLEPPTARLRSGCSTTELLRRSPIAVARGYRGRKSACHAARRYPGTHPLRLEHLTNARPCVDRRLGGAFRLRLGLGFVLQTGIVGRM